ncbi:hypothetical protein BDW59DRAFT_36855 [Aspergillus cavernicola]|uniref:NAD(P)-binding protein n=1 Tax=Aspergillus cavernicola TaxID=176166 RepID=A0ABR4HB48_9EURO
MSLKNVVVIIGVGGMGLAIARRVGSGSHLVLADFSPAQLDNAAKTLREEGHAVDAIQTDVSSTSSVQSLAKHASQLGVIRIVAHTAGLSPTQALADRIYQVDLLGPAFVIDAFLLVVSPGTSLVVIASLAGHGNPEDILSADFTKHLATAPATQLLNHPDFNPASSTPEDSPGLHAYQISKQANILRVQASALAYGKQGARINTISPGIISTAMGHQELAGPLGDHIRDNIVNGPVGRVGTAADIANVVAFLCSPDASFITGTDILLDGGWLAKRRWN